MAVTVGDKVPDVELRVLGHDGPEAVRSAEVLGSGKVVLFAVPGAFTPTCSDYHLPGYLHRIDDLQAKGVDTVACISVNDAWVMGAWGKAQRVGDKILMLADGNGDFARAMGLEMDAHGVGLGVRSKRYAAVITDGTITALQVEDKPGLDVSAVEQILPLV